MYLKIEKAGSLFRLSVLDINKIELFNCFYKFTGSYNNVTRATRSTSSNGNKIIQKNTKIKILMPIKNNCLAKIGQ